MSLTWRNASVVLLATVCSCSAVPRPAATPPPLWHPHRDHPGALLLVFEGTRSVGVSLEWTDQGSALRAIPLEFFRPYPGYQPLVVESEVELQELLAGFPLGNWPCNGNFPANGYWLTFEGGEHEQRRVADRLDVDSSECRAVVKRARAIAKLAGISCQPDGRCEITAPRYDR